MDSALLACNLHRKHSDAGTVLHFHGNGEPASEYAQDSASLFLDLGMNVCFTEYCGYGLSAVKPALVAMLDDGERIVRVLGVAPERLVVFGRSLGSLYAIELAQRLPVLAGMVIESSVDLLGPGWRIWWENQAVRGIFRAPGETPRLSGTAAGHARGGGSSPAALARSAPSCPGRVSGQASGGVPRRQSQHGIPQTNLSCLLSLGY